jgi:hypothetical protein
MKPVIGHWYKIQGSDSFEVVAIDDDDGTIELQYFDGTVEEMDIEDWQAEHENGALEEIEPPEDWTGSVDVDPEEDESRDVSGFGENDDRQRSSGRLEGLDLFE